MSERASESSVRSERASESSAQCARIYTDAYADLAVPFESSVAVLGYGNQGAARAQNMRDSGTG
ncbi:MAG: hypothetical protein ACRDRL_28235 [Sciscionella sp.]